MNVILIYDCSVYYWFVHVNIEPSLIVGWFEVELLSGLRLLGSVLCEGGDRVVDCEAMCGLMNGDMKCMNVLCVNPAFPSMCQVSLSE